MLRFSILLLLGLICFATASDGQSQGDRQSYSAWTKHSAKNYYYRKYNFKISANDDKPAYHYAIYFPSRGKKIYMYNPQTRKYWGAWQGDKYSMLPKEKQKASIDEIAAEDFPPPTAPPIIPGINDKVTMIPPPSDFPKLDDDRP